MNQNSSKINNLSVICSIMISFSLICQIGELQAQPVMTNVIAENVILGNYNPSTYKPSVVIKDKDSILQFINNEISRDSLKNYLIKLEAFGNRNSGSDTNSLIRGIGATRRWIKNKFSFISANNENRLLVSYLDFSVNMCGVNKHRNVLAVLPGTDTSKHGLLVVQAHMDSRCKGSCDTACYAPGMDDNGSGTALVLELARVLSRLSFDRTIVFAALTGEEQGLEGGEALAEYLQMNQVDFMACLTNDVVGGTECGLNSSSPSCSPVGSIDSTNLRVFSFSPANDSNLVSEHKQLARYIKLQQIEEINPRQGFQTEIKLQIREDRIGRGGDHIPFRQKNMRAIRFTSSNEHGNGSGNAPDRQHTTTDVLGYDLSVPPDGILDTFLVDFNYLRRNTLTNGINLSLLAMSPPIPQVIVNSNNFGNVESVQFVGVDTLYSHRIGIRSRNSPDLYFDTVLTYHKHLITSAELFPKGNVQLHFMNMEGEIESIPTDFTNEPYLSDGNTIDEINCLELYPNPVRDVLKLKWICAMTIENLEINIVNGLGQIEMSAEFSGKGLAEIAEVNLSELASASYQLVAIVNKDEIFTQTLIIE